MRQRTTASVALLALLVTGALGCSRPIIGSIEHPARLGRVPENRIVRHDRRAESVRSASPLNGQHEVGRLSAGSMDDVVQLVRFDPAGVCFHLTLRHPHAAPITIPPNAGASLAALPQGQASSDARWTIRGPEGVAAQASAPTETLTGRMRCDEYGCGREVQYGTRSFTREAFETAALLCFPNEERFGPETEALELHVPHGHFRWELGAPASGWPQQVITLSPAYVAATDELLRGTTPAVAAQALLGGSAPAASAGPPAARHATEPPRAPTPLSAYATGTFVIAPMTLVTAAGQTVVTVEANGDIRDARYIVGRIQGGLLTWRGAPLFAVDAHGELHSREGDAVAPAGRLTRDGMATPNESIAVGRDGRLTVTQGGRRQQGTLRYLRPPPSGARGTAALVAVLAATLR